MAVSRYYTRAGRTLSRSMAAYLESDVFEVLVVFAWSLMAAFNSVAVISLKDDRARYQRGDHRG